MSATGGTGSSRGVSDAAVEALRAAGRGQTSWCDASHQVCRAVGADAASIVIWQEASREVETQEGFGFDEGLTREYAQHYCQHDVLLQLYLPPGQWQVSNERCPDAQWARHPFFGDFLHRWRVGQIAALTLHAGGGRLAALSLHRHTRGNIGSKDFGHGELARLTHEAEQAFETRYGAVVAARHALNAALTDAQSSAFLVDAFYRALPLAPGCQVRQTPPLAFREGRVIHPVARAQRRLLELLRGAVTGQRGRIAVPGVAGPLSIEAIPLPPQARFTDSQALALVRVLDRGPSSLPDESELADYFGLTPAQARVLRLLCDGGTVAECAERLCCSEGTVRTHVAQLMLRMDCSRQAQLVRAAMMLMT